MRSGSSLLARLAATLAVTFAACGLLTASAGAAYNPENPAEKAEYEHALAIGVQGYKYGLPAVDTDRIFSTFTSVNVCNPEQGYGPVNQFCSIKQLAEPTNHDIVAPNHDTLYSLAWLDLSGEQPIVMHVPTNDRFHVFELLDTYTNNFANIGGADSALYPNFEERPFARPDGDYILAGPNQTVDPTDTKGLPVVHAPTSRVWVIGRTEVLSPEDVAHVNKLQSSYTLTPLNTFKIGQTWSPKPPKTPVTTPTIYHIPGTQAAEDPIEFFKALGGQLAKFPPPAADQPELEQLASVGIGAGLNPAKTQSQATLAGLREAVKAAGPAAVNQDLHNAFLAGFAAHNGWLVQEAGSYGTDYSTRAYIDSIGVGTLDSRVATYPIAQTDRTGAPLTALKRYVVHFPAGTLPPPLQQFWSLTLYDKNQFLVENVAKRYLLNDRSTLHSNEDGSLDIYLQPKAPTNQAQYDNWLPSPPAGDPTNPSQLFNLVMRLYGITPSAYGEVVAGTGWKPPTILPCNEETDKTAAGWNCAN